MFFSSLLPLLNKGVTVQLILQAHGDRILLDVMPTGEAGTQYVPKQFAGTAEELDAEIVSIMGGYAQINTTLSQQLADAQAVANAMANDAAKAATSTKKPGAKAERPLPQSTDGSPAEDGEQDVLGGDPPNPTVTAAAAAAPADSQFTFSL